ncbi:hypothetical protein S245_053217 [Arachis hypogaea]|nr:uncharacterized protein DS421_15g516580 [Arachis hypogaea]
MRDASVLSLPQGFRGELFFILHSSLYLSFPFLSCFTFTIVAVHNCFGNKRCCCVFRRSQVLSSTRRRMSIMKRKRNNAVDESHRCVDGHIFTYKPLIFEEAKTYHQLERG